MLVSLSLPSLLLLASLASAAHSPSLRGTRNRRHASLKKRIDIEPWVCSTVTRVGSDQGGLKWKACEGEVAAVVAPITSSSISSYTPEPTIASTSTYEEPAPTTTSAPEEAPAVQTTEAAAVNDFQAETTSSPCNDDQAQLLSSSSSSSFISPPEPTSIILTTSTDDPAPIPITSTLADEPSPSTDPIFVETMTSSSPSPSPDPTTTQQQQPASTEPQDQPTTTTAEPAAETTAPASAPIAAAVVASSSSSSSSSDDQSRYLAAHNSFRALYGAGELTWSEDAAKAAVKWAGRCVFEHSGGTLGSFGENLAAGTGSGYTIESAIKSWTDEAKDYNPSAPNFSHFTQVVWKGTTQVGCAAVDCDGIFDASFGKAKYYVCEYSRPGNVAGQFGANVGSLA